MKNTVTCEVDKFDPEFNIWGRRKPLTTLYAKANTIEVILVANGMKRPLPKPSQQLVIRHQAGGVDRLFKSKIKDSDRGALLWAWETWAVNSYE